MRTSWPGMVNVVHRTCEHSGCCKLPSFAFADTRSTFCGEHKAPGMINVRQKRRAPTRSGDNKSSGANVDSATESDDYDDIAAERVAKRGAGHEKMAEFTP